PFICGSGNPKRDCITALFIGRAKIELLPREEKHRLHAGAFLLRMIQIGHEVLRRTNRLVGLLGIGALKGQIVTGDDESSHSPSGFLRLRGRLRWWLRRLWLRGLHWSQCNPRKERRQLVKLFALPAIGFMIVAIRALDLYAKENSRNFRSNVGRV